MVGGRRSTNRYGRKKSGKKWPLILAAIGGGWLAWNWTGSDAPASPTSDVSLSGTADLGGGLPAAPVDTPVAIEAPVDPFAPIINAISEGDTDAAERLNAEKLDSTDAATAARARLFAADIALRKGETDTARGGYDALTSDGSEVGTTACMRLAELAERESRIGDALTAWTRAWQHGAAAPRRSEIAERAWTLASRSLLSRELYTGCETYTVQPGDSLSRIANKQQTTIGLLRAANNIKGDLIYRGDRLKIVRGPARLVVEKSRCAMALFLGDTLVREFQVCIGKENRTPAATFVIQTKIVNPDWYWRGKRIPFGDPENILGTRWMGFRQEPNLPQGLGIHGTTQPESIPGTGSMGCVRMRNAEVEELFELVERGTQVEIRE